MEPSIQRADSKVASARPNWQLPQGVPRGAWDYVNKSSIATEYDRFHEGHPLLTLDQQIVYELLGESALREDVTSKIAVDCGCGTGRNLLPLAARGWRVMGVDLSSDMLRTLRAKAEAMQLPKARSLPDGSETSVAIGSVAIATGSSAVATVRANMANLGFLRDGFADAVLCMYSSIGMLQGRSNRRQFLQHAARVLREEGWFVVHVHNRGSWLRDPGGVRKTIRDWWRSRTDPEWELGDSVYSYRGLPTMFLHIYSERELRSDLLASGLILHKLYRLNRTSSQFFDGGWFKHVRSGGFIAICRRKS